MERRSTKYVGALHVCFPDFFVTSEYLKRNPCFPDIQAINENKTLSGPKGLLTLGKIPLGSTSVDLTRGSLNAIQISWSRLRYDVWSAIKNAKEHEKTVRRSLPSEDAKAFNILRQKAGRWLSCGQINEELRFLIEKFSNEQEIRVWEAVERLLVTGNNGSLELSKLKLTDFPQLVLQFPFVASIYLGTPRSLPISAGLSSLLTHLDLSRNRLRALPEEVATLKGLETLNIGHNLIQHLPPSIMQLQRLRRFEVTSNPLDSSRDAVRDTWVKETTSVDTFAERKLKRRLANRRRLSAFPSLKEICGAAVLANNLMEQARDILPALLTIYLESGFKCDVCNRYAFNTKILNANHAAPLPTQFVELLSMVFTRPRVNEDDGDYRTYASETDTVQLPFWRKICSAYCLDLHFHTENAVGDSAARNSVDAVYVREVDRGDGGRDVLKCGCITCQTLLQRKALTRGVDDPVAWSK
ncbi:hypothetical protein HK102_003260 [Quaeritorhiza haematococci]|nr:hypothetical protein HK102_003260 [Quaeritorhiza haematococci]